MSSILISEIFSLELSWYSTSRETSIKYFQKSKIKLLRYFIIFTVWNTNYFSYITACGKACWKKNATDSRQNIQFFHPFRFIKINETLEARWKSKNELEGSIK